jgi:hypothetical protein
MAIGFELMSVIPNKDNKLYPFSGYVLTIPTKE